MSAATFNAFGICKADGKLWMNLAAVVASGGITEPEAAGAAAGAALAGAVDEPPAAGPLEEAGAAEEVAGADVVAARGVALLAGGAADGLPDAPEGAPVPVGAFATGAAELEVLGLLPAGLAVGVVDPLLVLLLLAELLPAAGLSFERVARTPMPTAAAPTARPAAMAPKAPPPPEPAGALGDPGEAPGPLAGPVVPGPPLPVLGALEAGAPVVEPEGDALPVPGADGPEEGAGEEPLVGAAPPAAEGAALGPEGAPGALVGPGGPEGALVGLPLGPEEGAGGAPPLVPGLVPTLTEPPGPAPP